MNKPLLSVAHLTAPELAPPDYVTAAHKAGYDMVDIRIRPAVPGGFEYPMPVGSPMFRETMKRLADTGMKVFDIELIRLNDRLKISDLASHFETAAALGAQRIKVVMDTPDKALTVDLFGGICERVQPLGLFVDIEFMIYTEVKTLDAAIDICRKAACKNGAVLLDALHHSRTGGTLDEVLKADKAFISYFHICDAPAQLPADVPEIIRESREDRLVPGEGGLPLAEMLAALPAGLPVSIELPMKDRPAAQDRLELGIAGARKIIAKANDIRAQKNP